MEAMEDAANTASGIGVVDTTVNPNEAVPPGVPQEGDGVRQEQDDPILIGVDRGKEYGLIDDVETETISDRYRRSLTVIEQKSSVRGKGFSFVYHHNTKKKIQYQ